MSLAFLTLNAVLLLSANCTFSYVLPIFPVSAVWVFLVAITVPGNPPEIVGVIWGGFTYKNETMPPPPPPPGP